MVVVEREARADVQASRWSALTRIARYQASLKQLQQELAARHGDWQQEKAVLQVRTEGQAQRNPTTQPLVNAYASMCVQLRLATCATVLCTHSSFTPHPTTPASPCTSSGCCILRA